MANTAAKPVPKSGGLLAAVSRAARPDVVANTIPDAGTTGSSPKFERPSRKGTKFVAGHFDPVVARQIRMLAVEEDTTVQALLAEAIDLLFVKKNRPVIEELIAKRG